MRKFNVTVNGKTYAVEVEETEGGAQAPVSAAPVVSAPKPAAAAVPAGGTKLNAPMPGLVLKLNVANGATVKKGDKLLVLEAMKMENDIVSPADGVVAFAVKQGDNVETGAVLASIN